MQEIATGVYVGNFNTRIREQLWKRVQESIGDGEATISYAYRNEIGYQFELYNCDREVVNFEGIPLVRIPSPQRAGTQNKLKPGFSKASHFHKARKYSAKPPASIEENSPTYIVIDLETDGLDETANHILEIAAIKVEPGQLTFFQRLINNKTKLPQKIVDLTGITETLLAEDGLPLKDALKDFLNFIGDHPLVGYNIAFDVQFLNINLRQQQLPSLSNKYYDLMRYVKKDKILLKNYKLQTVLPAYNINEAVQHRALEDCKVTYQLAEKLPTFLEDLKKDQ